MRPLYCAPHVILGDIKMKNNSGVSRVELLFPLAINDDWPPVSVEGLPCIEEGDVYKIDSPPLFIKGLSVGDRIKAEYDKEYQVVSWTHKEKSDRSTIWILRKNSNFDLDSILSSVRIEGCNTVYLRQYGIASVDVPGDVSMSVIDEIFERFNSDDFAVAYSSFRHSEHGSDS